MFVCGDLVAFSSRFGDVLPGDGCISGAQKSSS
jgi:hypothetical protein